jgi:transcriptional antiterminator Rof (Rho-off)
MGHLMDRCDVIDVLESSAKLHRAVTVELKNGRKFVDQAKDVVTEADSPEWVQFRDIVFCAPADPPSSSYDAKL